MKRIITLFAFTLPLFCYSQNNKSFTVATTYRSVGEGNIGKENFTIKYNGEYINFFDNDYNTSANYQFPLEMSDYGYSKDGTFYESYTVKKSFILNNPGKAGKDMRVYGVYYDSKGGSILYVAENRKMLDGSVNQTYYFTADYYNEFIKK